jgi:adenine/guanine phosphoribosyltransferase-like PRPP-binding protein
MKRGIIEKFGQPNDAFTHITGIDSEGFILAAVLAKSFEVPMVPIFNKNKELQNFFHYDYIDHKKRD